MRSFLLHLLELLISQVYFVSPKMSCNIIVPKSRLCWLLCTGGVVQEMNEFELHPEPANSRFN